MLKRAQLQVRSRGPRMVIFINNPDEIGRYVWLAETTTGATRFNSVLEFAASAAESRDVVVGATHNGSKSSRNRSAARSAM